MHNDLQGPFRRRPTVPTITSIEKSMWVSPREPVRSRATPTASKPAPHRTKAAMFYCGHHCRFPSEVLHSCMKRVSAL